ncbi:MAG: hypothetical protein KF744_07675 [Taibaiella sp.]|nr:hypothetical protein [Taibaiella sp.]
MLKKNALTIIAFSLFSLFIASCGGGTSRPDTSGIKVELKSYRFDKDLYALDTNSIGPGLVKLKEKYPGFLDYFLDTLMAYEIYGNYSDTVPGIREGLKPFLVFKDYADLQDSIEAHYPDTKDVDAQLSDGFKLLKHYFPAAPVPEIYYLNLGLSKWPTFPLDSNTQCIALDMFLGDNFSPYQAVGVPQYMMSHLRKNYIPVSVFSSIYRAKHEWNPQEKNLLELIVDKGREQYYLHQLLPELPDTVLFGFTGNQMAWCEGNEALIYNFFVQNKLLYSKVAMDIMPYVVEGPFARGLEPVTEPVKKTPGSIGIWMGYKIVDAYMREHKDVSLAQLVDGKTDAAQILREARYKPR